MLMAFLVRWRLYTNKNISHTLYKLRKCCGKDLQCKSFRGGTETWGISGLSISSILFFVLSSGCNLRVAVLPKESVWWVEITWAMWSMAYCLSTLPGTAKAEQGRDKVSWGSSGTEIQLHVSCRPSLIVKIGLTILPLIVPMWTLFDVKDGLLSSAFLVILWASLSKLGSKMQTFQGTQTRSEQLSPALESTWDWSVCCTIPKPQAMDKIS